MNDLPVKTHSGNKVRRIISFILFALTMIQLNSAVAQLVPIVGHVQIIDTSSMPGSVLFQLDSSDATCPAGAWLWWHNVDLSNNKATYAALMTALVQAQRGQIYLIGGMRKRAGLV